MLMQERFCGVEYKHQVLLIWEHIYLIIFIYVLLITVMFSPNIRWKTRTPTQARAEGEGLDARALPPVGIVPFLARLETKTLSGFI